MSAYTRDETREMKEERGKTRERGREMHTVPNTDRYTCREVRRQKQRTRARKRAHREMTDTTQTESETHAHSHNIHKAKEMDKIEKDREKENTSSTDVACIHAKPPRTKPISSFIRYTLTTVTKLFAVSFTLSGQYRTSVAK